jgi:hypothetical protein
VAVLVEEAQLVLVVSTVMVVVVARPVEVAVLA